MRQTVKRLLIVLGVVACAAALVPLAPALSETLTSKAPVLAGGPLGPGATGWEARLPPSETGVAPPQPNEAEFNAQVTQADQQYALTPAEADQAHRIVGADAYLESLLQDTSYQISNIGSWKGASDEVAHGAVMDLTLSQRVSSPMTLLPVVEELPGTNYTLGTFQAALTNVQVFRVLVEFPGNRVVEVTPVADGIAQMVPGPLNPARTESEGR